MKFKKIGEKYLIRLIKGEEAMGILTNFCRDQGIKSGIISGIGGASLVTIGWYELSSKSYHWKDFSGSLEITSLNGNVMLLDSEPFLHIHVAFADENYQGFGGHLKQVIVGATLEVVIEKLDGEVSRKMDDEIGLNLLHL